MGYLKTLEDKEEKTLKNLVNAFIEKYGLLNVKKRFIDYVHSFPFQKEEKFKGQANFEIALKLTTSVFNVLSKKRKIMVQNMEPFKKGSHIFMIPYIWDYQMLVVYLGDMNKWLDLFQRLLGNLVKENEIKETDLELLMARLREIVMEERENAINNQVLIPVELQYFQN